MLPALHGPKKEQQSVHRMGLNMVLSRRQEADSIRTALDGKRPELRQRSQNAHFFLNTGQCMVQLKSAIVQVCLVLRLDASQVAACEEQHEQHAYLP